MALVGEREVLEGVARVARAHKSFDCKPDTRPAWRRQPARGAEIWTLTCGLRLNGALAGGAMIRLKTPTDVWEEDVYGHVEVRIPGVPRACRIDPIEWRPLGPHTNPPDAPEGLGLMTLFDRHHPSHLNRPLGVAVLHQTATGIAAPLPRDITTFAEYVHLCAEVWNCPDMRSIEAPEWKPTLF